MPQRQWNIRLRGQDGSELPLGKLITVQREFVYMYWAHPKDLRHDIGAWGLREAVLAHCAQHNVRWLCMYDKIHHQAWWITLDDAVQYATAGKEDKFGRTLNVPQEHFRLAERIDRFVPDSVSKVVLADTPLPAWRARTSVARKQPHQRQRRVEQASLFEPEGENDGRNG